MTLSFVLEVAFSKQSQVTCLSAAFFLYRKKAFEWQNSAIKPHFLKPLHLLGPRRSLCNLWSLSAQDHLGCYGCQGLEASSYEQWRLISLCRCADLSSLGNHIEKYTACLLLFFFMPDNKCAIFINAWKVVVICTGQDLLHHRTHPTHATLRHCRSWIERSVSKIKKTCTM